ncbi:MAG: glycoside hydrolase family 5 protein [Armatimonadetes bacterium]|nr:glycoside hydrolase family 5 protein [Armatimonadota bacterium]
MNSERVKAQGKRGRRSESARRVKPAAVVKPISLHPDNPHYFLFRGKPTVLITSAEHYGAVLNLEFDYKIYLDTLQKDGLNMTRVFTGAYREPAWDKDQNPLGPRPGQFIAPWARSATPGAAVGGNKFDLDRWDGVYFDRLKAFCRAASERGIVVEVVFFSQMYEDRMWRLSPLHKDNNVNGVGQRSFDWFITLDDPALVKRQEALIRKVVSELKGFDNVFYELCNEPYPPYGPGRKAGTVPVRKWLNHLAGVTAKALAALPARHLIAVQDPSTCDHPAVSVYNFHYANGDDRPEGAWVGAMQGLERYYHLNKPIFFDETETDRPASVVRREAWAFMLSGGAGYNHLDSSFMIDDETGSGKAEWFGKRNDYRDLRRQLSHLKQFIESVDFIRLSRRPGLVRTAPEGVKTYGIADPGRTYLVYLEGKGSGSLTLNAPDGRYRADWISPQTGQTVYSGSAAARDGSLKIDIPAFNEDLALRVRRNAGAAR